MIWGQWHTRVVLHVLSCAFNGRSCVLFLVRKKCLCVHVVVKPCRGNEGETLHVSFECPNLVGQSFHGQDASPWALGEGDQRCLDRQTGISKGANPVLCHQSAGVGQQCSPYKSSPALNFIQILGVLNIVHYKAPPSLQISSIVYRFI